MKKAFTLIELLVVISIIAVLMSIMMPALGRARLSAQSVVCKTRMKDIGSILYVYSNDFGGKIPPSTGSLKELATPGMSQHGDWRWPNRLRDYYDTKSKQNFKTTLEYAKAIHTMPMLRCPTQEKFTKLEGDTGGWLGTFGMNQFFTVNTGGDPFGWRKFDQILAPAGLPLLAELSGEACSWATVTNTNGENAGGGLVLQYNGPHHSAYNKYKWGKGKAEMGNYSLYGAAPNHTSKSNYLMADGHTDSLPIWPWRDFIGTDFHPKRSVKVLPPNGER